MRILLAEDETQLNRVIVAALEHEGYQVDSVANGRDAVQKAFENSYNVMIFDIMMPIMTGIEALQQIRTNGDTTHVIMLTAMAEIDDRVNGLDAGADDYLTKPFSLKELLARLRSMARRVEGYTKASIQVGNTLLTIDEQEVKAQNSIRLANKELHLLRYLMNNIDKDIHTKEIFDQVWADEKEDTDIVFLYISYLRQKLDSIQSNLKILDRDKMIYRLVVKGDESHVS
ncbi:response regulator transcription factor [Streptococcus parasanguinis]|uniref:response regulator transcription factor n=1 Tax=Streptococcus parasanguinis TaxID=1318 RepID=UPI0039C35F01